MDKPKVGDHYILHSEDGNDYDIKIINISEDGNDYDIKIIDVNECRPPDMLYATYVFCNGKNCYEDVVFLGDYFFESRKDRLEKMR